MKVLVEEQHDLPLVEVQVVARSGPAGDPEGKEGLARHSFELMRRGAGGKSRAEIDAAFDALGAQVDSMPTHDSVGLTATCLTRNLEPVLGLLGDLLVRPQLDESEHDKLIREELAALDEVRDDDASLASRFFDRAALAGGPYGRSAFGSDASLASLRRADAAAWVSEAIVGDNLILGLAGDVSAERAQALLQTAFAGVADRPAPPAARAVALTARGRRTVIVDKPERVQSQILLGHPAPPPSHPDYLALHLACTAFGGTFSSRLVKEVRVKRGWSYGVSLRVARARGGHSVRLRVFPAAEQTPDTLALVLGLWEEVVAGGLSDEEVAHARSYLEGSWAFELATPGERLDRRLETDVLDLAPDWVATYVARLRALDVAAVNQALKRHSRPDQATIVVTATAEEMVPRLSGLSLGAIEVVDYLSY